MSKTYDGFGQLHGKDTLFFRVDGGTAKLPDGRVYELSTNVGGASPIVLSKQTGRWFTLKWSDIVSMAIDAGIDEKKAEPEKKLANKAGRKS